MFNLIIATLVFAVIVIAAATAIRMFWNCIEKKLDHSTVKYQNVRTAFISGSIILAITAIGCFIAYIRYELPQHPWLCTIIAIILSTLCMYYAFKRDSILLFLAPLPAFPFAMYFIWQSDLVVFFVVLAMILIGAPAGVAAGAVQLAENEKQTTKNDA